MSSPIEFLKSLRESIKPLGLADLLTLHPDVPRRTAQRWIKQLIEKGEVVAFGQGRARCYRITDISTVVDIGTERDEFPSYIPVSPDSADILDYLAKPMAARKPIGYQFDFIESYRPNKTCYLPEPLRRQLRKMGVTKRAGLPAGTYGRAILNRLLIDLSWASSNLEGNTYSHLDTRNLIELGKAARGKPAIETQMILNHKNAIELLVENSDDMGFNRYSILNLHSTLSENLLPNPADEGRVRTYIVEIGKSVYRPLSIPAKISEMLDIVLNKAERITDPYEQSFFIMVHLPYLQPFVDINKRTSRLMANLPLIRENLCPLTFVDVSRQAYSRAILGVYELTRVELLRDLYLWAYERSTQTYLTIKRGITEPDPLRLTYRSVIKHAVRAVVLSIEGDQLDIIQSFVTKNVEDQDKESVRSLVIDEIRRLHEGVLSRYDLRISDYNVWKNQT